MNEKINCVCRICLLKEGELVNIFQNDVPQNIMNFASVKIDYLDGFPEHICNKCIDELNIAIKFKRKCEQSYKKLCTYFHSLSNASRTSSINETNDPYPHLYIELKNEISNASTSPQYESKFEKLHKIISQEYSYDGKTEIINVYECNICAKQELCLTDFQNHVCDSRNKYDNSIHTCKICSMKIISIKKFQSHVKIHEEKIFKSEDKNTDNVKTEDFNICSDKNSNRKSKVQQCELCGKITNYKYELVRHMRIHTGDLPYKCGQCDKSFRCKPFLTKHLLTHTRERNHHCMFCSKSFVLQSSLYSHMQSHSNEKKYPCNICNKKFKAARTLKNHIKIHTGERNFPCSICDKAFINRFDLGRHLKLHRKHRAIVEGTYDESQERPKQLHQCETCGKFVPSLGDLTKHTRVHTGEKPFKCQTCGKTFSGTSALTVHVRTHTGAKPYTCQHCGSAFRQSSNLKVHIRLHTGVRPYTCSICDRGFNRKRDLAGHLRKHGSEKL